MFSKLQVHKDRILLVSSGEILPLCLFSDIACNCTSHSNCSRKSLSSKDFFRKSLDFKYESKIPIYVESGFLSWIFLSISYKRPRERMYFLSMMLKRDFSIGMFFGDCKSLFFITYFRNHLVIYSSIIPSSTFWYPIITPVPSRCHH